MDCLHIAYVNPAFVVQLFAHLLHRLNARVFNFIVNADGKLVVHSSPVWGRVLHGWIHAALCRWAKSQGLGVIAECYLQRVSQVSPPAPPEGGSHYLPVPAHNKPPVCFSVY